MANTLKIALVQYPHDADPAQLIAEAAARDAEIVVFPEMFSNGYAKFEDAASEKLWRAGAVEEDGEYVDQFRTAARENEIHVVATILEEGNPDPFNTAILIDPSGETVLRHRKVHTCFFATPEKACGRGEGFDVAQITTTCGPVTVGMMICMDREYPDAASTLSAAGAEIALIPNASHMATDPIVGDLRLAHTRGKAFESVMGLALANYPAPSSDGHSLAVDPFGRILVEAETQPCTLFADFDIDLIRKIRKEDWFRWQQLT